MLLEESDVVERVELGESEVLDATASSPGRFLILSNRDVMVHAKKKLEPVVCGMMLQCTTVATSSSSSTSLHGGSKTRSHKIWPITANPKDNFSIFLFIHPFRKKYVHLKPCRDN